MAEIDELPVRGCSVDHGAGPAGRLVLVRQDRDYATARKSPPERRDEEVGEGYRVTKDGRPGYSGSDLMAAASAAVDHSRSHALSIRPLIQKLARRAAAEEEIDGLDPDVQALIDLIVRAGLPPPPLLRAGVPPPHLLPVRSVDQHGSDAREQQNVTAPSGPPRQCGFCGNPVQSQTVEGHRPIALEGCEEVPTVLATNLPCGHAMIAVDAADALVPRGPYRPAADHSDG